VVPAEAFTVEFGLLENLELVAVSGKDVNMISIPELDQMSNLRPFGMFDTSINETITVNIGDMTDVGQSALSQVAAFASVLFTILSFLFNHSDFVSSNE
jgi:hypothetical protein